MSETLTLFTDCKIQNKFSKFDTLTKSSYKDDLIRMCDINNLAVTDDTMFIYTHQKGAMQYDNVSNQIMTVGYNSNYRSCTIYNAADYCNYVFSHRKIMIPVDIFKQLLNNKLVIYRLPIIVTKYDALGTILDRSEMISTVSMNCDKYCDKSGLPSYQVIIDKINDICNNSAYLCKNMPSRNVMTN